LKNLKENKKKKKKKKKGEENGILNMPPGTKYPGKKEKTELKSG
jgi:hypothetical protein